MTEFPRRELKKGVVPINIESQIVRVETNLQDRTATINFNDIGAFHMILDFVLPQDKLERIGYPVVLQRPVNDDELEDVVAGVILSVDEDANTIKIKFSD